MRIHEDGNKTTNNGYKCIKQRNKTMKIVVTQIKDDNTLTSIQDLGLVNVKSDHELLVQAAPRKFSFHLLEYSHRDFEDQQMDVLQ